MGLVGKLDVTQSDGPMKISGSIYILLVCCVSLAVAHPIPDIPVFSTFDKETVTIEVIIDPRSFNDDPTGEPYMHNSELGFKNGTEKQKLKDKGQDLIDCTVVFKFSPGETLKPVFSFDFIGLDKTELKQDTDPVMLIGLATVEIPDGATSYQLIADESGALSVVFRNMLKGEEVDRYMVLFPGESSFELDITQR